MNKLLMTLAALTTAMIGRARADMARMDVVDFDKSQSIKQVQANCRTSPMGWIKKNPLAGHIFQCEAGPTWTLMQATLVPEADSVWILSFKGQWKRDPQTNDLIPIEVYVDQVEVNGAECRNGSFETVDPQTGLPSGWKGHAGFAKADRYLDDPDGAKDGRRYVKVWHNLSLSQGLKVTKGQPVTIRAWVKKAD